VPQVRFVDLGLAFTSSSRIQPEYLLDLANPLSAQMIEAKHHNCDAANGAQTLYFMAFPSEMLGPHLLNWMKQRHWLACRRVSARSRVALAQIASWAG
jgi:hypothetical protein